MTLLLLPKNRSLKGARILVRVDWNVPINGIGPEDSLKFERTIPFIRELSEKGAKPVLLTHIGRPKKRDSALSTKRLVSVLKQSYGLDVTYHKESVGKAQEKKRLKEKIGSAEKGSIHLLENVRFEKGEEKGLKTLAKAYAELGDMFINDAFASCHRAHASVSVLPTYFKDKAFAGPDLAKEVGELSKLLKTVKKPFVAVIGGKKLSTKIPVLKKFLERCDAVLIGGAMSAPFLKAAGYSVGASYFDKTALADAKKLLSKKNLFLPGDVMVMHKSGRSKALRHAEIADIKKDEMIVDVGPATLAAWGALLSRAKTMVWNGPIGMTERHASGFGSRFIARVMGAHAKGPAFGLAGGGDTIPVIRETHAQEWFDFVSTGGGAMLEFIAQDGKLPGLKPIATYGKRKG